MKNASYNPKDDILRLLWSDVPIQDDELEPGVIVDYDSDSNIGIEVLNVSAKIKQLDKNSYKLQVQHS